MSSNPSVAIVGVGEVKPARHVPGDHTALAVSAIEQALTDAGLTFADIDGIVTENGFMPTVLPDLCATLNLPSDMFIGQAGNAGIGLVGSPELAGLLLASGRATTVVCFYAARFGSEATAVYDYHAKLPYKAAFELPIGFFPQAIYMAAMANRYINQYGYGPDDFYPVVSTQREWAMRNENAIKRELLTEDEYLAKPMIADPLRNVDCSLMNDGAIAFVMTTEERARDLRHPVVSVGGVATAYEPVAEHSYLGVRADLTTLPARLSAPRALGQAGLQPGDIDVFELYDCFSIIPVVQLEDIGVFERGEALGRYRKGEMKPGGKTPVNTHGGLLAHSYLIGGNHVIEAVKQLRGDAGEAQVADASTALVTGWSAQEHATLVLQRS